MRTVACAKRERSKQRSGPLSAGALSLQDASRSRAGELDKILVDFGADRSAKAMGIRLPQHAQCARRGDENQRLGLAGIDGGIEALGKLA